MDKNKIEKDEEKKPNKALLFAFGLTFICFGVFIYFFLFFAFMG